MTFSRRAACVLSRFKPAIEVVVVQPPADNEDLLRVCMGLSPEGLRISARQEAGQSGVFTGHWIDTKCDLLGHSPPDP